MHTLLPHSVMKARGGHDTRARRCSRSDATAFSGTRWCPPSLGDRLHLAARGLVRTDLRHGGVKVSPESEQGPASPRATQQAIPHNLHLIWLGSPPTPELRNLVNLLEGLNPGWKARLWTDSDLGWLRNRGLFDLELAWQGKADIARYEILHREGGYYLVVDFEPIQE